MKTIISIMLTITLNLSGGYNFKSLLKLHESKDFFRFAGSLNNAELNEWQKIYINVLNLNLNHKNEDSNRLIDSLLTYNIKDITDSLVMQLYETRMKNSVNLFNYKDAVYCSGYILNNYSSLLDSNELDEINNSLIIWKSAENLPPEIIELSGDSFIKTSKDMAGLINIPVKCAGIEEDFIFDTGANFSVVNKTYAGKMKLKLLDGKIKVGSSTGKKVESQLAYAELIETGNMKFRNVLFLVLPDESLSFAGGLYTINGIIGLPVIKEMKEVHIRKDVIFVPKTPVKRGLNNLLIDGFIPVIEVVEGNDSLAFTFDTGARKTMLYSDYYLRNKEAVDKKYEPEDIEFEGAGGTIIVKGFKLENILLKIGNSKYKLDEVSLLAEKLKMHEKQLFGNLGQDYMSRFSEMILNFDDMYVDFK